jgi:hypothetical protein
MTDLEKAARQALEALITASGHVNNEAFVKVMMARDALVEALKKQPAPVPEAHKQSAERGEPVAWMPIEQMYPQAKAIDILMGDGSILCAVLPQFDGDLWWEGSGTGEKFIDPKYANVTHWRIHDERTSPPAQRKPLTDEEIWREYRFLWPFHPEEERKLASDILEFARAIEAKLKEKNNG